MAGYSEEIEALHAIIEEKDEMISMLFRALSTEMTTDDIKKLFRLERINDTPLMDGDAARGK